MNFPIGLSSIEISKNFLKIFFCADEKKLIFETLKKYFPHYFNYLKNKNIPNLMTFF